MRRATWLACATAVAIALIPAGTASAGGYHQLAHAYSSGGSDFNTGPWVPYRPVVDIVVYCRDGDDPPGMTERRARYIYVTKDRWYFAGTDGTYRLPCDGRRHALRRAAVSQQTTYSLKVYVSDGQGHAAASEAYVDVFGIGRSGY